MTVLQELNTGTKLEDIVREVCLHQAFKECRPCTYDPVNNPICPEYYGIRLRYFEIKDGRL